MLIYYLSTWAVIAISLTNTILLLWLGFTILLNAERRSWGVWLIGGGLLMGGAFFVSHTIILALGLTTLGGTMNFWWDLGLGAVISLPFAWYTAMLWYAGFWEKRDSILRYRHRLWYGAAASLMIALWALLLLANPFPTFEQAINLMLAPTPTIFGLPVLVLFYPVCTLLCIGLALDALLRPGPARRMMGDLARRRAQPFLIATSAVLLLVGALVCWVMLRVVVNAGERYAVQFDELLRIAYSDLIISGLITLAVLSLGQAVARYEVFTGKTLPQQRFMRHWHNAVLLAVGFGAVLSAGLTIDVPPIYIVLMTALLVTLFYTLFSRSSYVERERYIEHLRPFVTSQRLYEHMTRESFPAGGLPTAFDISTPFYALCDEILGASCAYLLPVGAFAPLIGQAMVYPAHASSPLLHDLIERFSLPQTMVVGVDPVTHGGAAWAIPLWSERGLIGVLLLGEKRNGSLFTQEEIEIARASGERLIDMQASAEMARRLMNLQRQRLAQTQVVDRRTRRMLHDDVLPRLHAAMLTLSMESQDGDVGQSVVDQLAELHHQIADLLHETAPAPEVGRIGLIPALKQALSGELGGAFDRVTWRIDEAVEGQANALPALTAEVVYYAAREAMRNAAVYGRGADAKRPLHLCVSVAADMGLSLSIEDNGVGMTPSDESAHGSGHGLALHGTMMAVIGGALTVESAPDRFTRIALTVP